MSHAKLTIEQKEANKLTRKQAKKEAAELARIEREKNQKTVREIKISIEWRKSRMYGNNPFLDAQIWFKDGSYESMTSTCSGCGYDKESTVIADVFNAFLKYKLYPPLNKTDRDREDGPPYGIYINQNRHYSGGIGTTCYYAIADAIGGKFENTASGKTYDAYKYTDLN